LINNSLTLLLLWERCLCAMNKLQQLHVGMLWGCCVHAVTGKFDILGVFRGDSTAHFLELCGIAAWCERGSFIKIAFFNKRSYEDIKLIWARSAHVKLFWPALSFVVQYFTWISSQKLWTGFWPNCTGLIIMMVCGTK